MIKSSNSKLIRFKKLFLISLFFFPFISLAQGLVPCGGENQPPCQLCDLFVLLNNIFKFFITEIVPLVAVLLIAIGGFLFVLGAEDPQHIEKAKSIFKSVAIGLFLIFSAWLIVNLFLTWIGVAEWNGFENWFEINCPHSN
jgi:hypothetical protein